MKRTIITLGVLALTSMALMSNQAQASPAVPVPAPTMYPHFHPLAANLW